MKKYMLKIAIIAITLMVIMSNFVFAVDFADADKFIERGTANAKISDLGEIAGNFSALGNILRFVGIGIVIAATAYMGILYMVSAPEKQAKLKQQLIGLIVSAVVIIGGYYIWSILTKALDSLT